jgi:hypothetical protein
MMMPPALRKSYHFRADYPMNLISSEIATYKDMLLSYRDRLDDAEVDLCLVNDEDEVNDIFEVLMIDMATGDHNCMSSPATIVHILTTTALYRKKIHTPEKLTEWLGVIYINPPDESSMEDLRATKRDPRCRFM